MKLSKPMLVVGAGIGLVLLLVVVSLSLPRSRRMIQAEFSGGAASDVFSVGTSGGAAGVTPAAPRETTQKLALNDQAVSNAGTDITLNRLIIKTGFLSLVVKDVPQGVAKIQEFAKSKGGFVVSSNISKDTLSPTAEVTIRIPSEVFDGGVQEVKSMGEVKSERVNGQDVTEEYVDLDARLKNLRLTESQFVTIMQKAQKIEDILAVQRELTQIRGEIESLQGRMKYLTESAKMSTLTVYLAADPQNLPVVDNDDSWKPLAVWKDAVRSLLLLGQGVVNFLIWIVAYIPVWIVLLAVVLGIRRVIIKRKV